MSYPTSQSKRRGRQLAAVAGSDKVPSRLPDEVVRTVGGPSLDGTDSASPTAYALDRGREVHGFVVDTDPETGARASHRAIADDAYSSGIEARMVVVGMGKNRFTIAEPSDPGALDVVGFDTATPQLVSDFARRAL